MAGRQIRIFLVDGAPTGLRTAEIGLSTVKAVLVPRGSIQQFAPREEARRTGVYVLVGPDPDHPARLRIYIGEGDDVLTRIIAHDASDKDFWDRVVVFVSKDANLTKAHVRFLEARLVALAQAAKRCSVDNRTSPVGGQLPEADQAEMDEFLDQVMVLLSVLGVNAFAPGWNEPGESAQPRSDELVLTTSGNGYSAECVLRDGAFIVKAGSLAKHDHVPSLPKGSIDQRLELLDSGVLSDTGEALRFEQDYEFASASAAAQVVVAASVNGREYWKLEDGQTLKAWQTAQIAGDTGQVEEEQ